MPEGRSSTRLHVTHPGKIGDLIWGLSALREHITRRLYDPVEFYTTTYCMGLLPILRAQPYIHDVHILGGWKVIPATPGFTPAAPDEADVPSPRLHMGMEEWPRPTLYEDYYRRLRLGYPQGTPWLERPTSAQDHIVIGFTDNWAEVKAALIARLAMTFHKERFVVVAMPGQRVATEWTYPFPNISLAVGCLEAAADWISRAKLFVGCKSALRVLAIAMGVPTVALEPSGPHHNKVFDPPPELFPQHRVLNGFDAREAVGLTEEAIRAL